MLSIFNNTIFAFLQITQKNVRLEGNPSAKFEFIPVICVAYECHVDTLTFLLLFAL